MAARPSTMSPRSRAGNTVYEDFEPKSEWTEDAAAHVLAVHLPGFAKDQIKITYDEKPPRMTIRGERFIGNNLVSRFIKEFPIPENSKLNEMRAKFDQLQVLTVSMPKKTVAPEITRPKVEAPKDQKLQPETPLSPRNAGMDRKPPPKAREEKTSPPQKAAAAAAAMGRESEKKTEEKATAPTTASPKAPAITKPKSQKGMSEIIETPPEATGQKQADDRVSQPLRPMDDTSRPKSWKIREDAPPNAPRSVADAQKLTEPVPEPADREVRLRDIKAPKEKDRSRSKGPSSQARIGKEAVLGLGEDRRLLVNVGMAVLVIVAVGAYLGYKLGSSGGGSRPRD